ncbi:MAG: hypothetical protein ABIJ34_04235 [archaeon]
MSKQQTTGYLKKVQASSRPKYRYLAMGTDVRIRKHKKGSYPRKGIFKQGLGPIVDLGNADLTRKNLADLETRGMTGNRKEIARELVMMGFSQVQPGLFVKDRYYVDLNSREVKRKQKSYPKDTKVPFKNIVIPTSLDKILPKGYLCNYTLKQAISDEKKI